MIRMCRQFIGSLCGVEFIGSLCGVVVAVCVLGAGPFSPPATAAFGFSAFDSGFSSIGSAGTSLADTRAGARTDLDLYFRMRTDAGPNFADQDPRDLTINLPPGVLGDPAAIPQCSREQFAGRLSEPGDLSKCPASSQVGVMKLEYNNGRDVALPTPDSPKEIPVYNVERRSDQETARLGFFIPGLRLPVNISVQPRTDGDFGLEAKVRGIIRIYQLISVRMTLWGYPSDPVHDSQRFNDFRQEVGTDEVRPNPQNPSAFLSSPTRCGTALFSSISGVSFEEPDNVVSRSTLMSEGLTGCDLIPFEPSLDVVGREPVRADAPAGVDVSVGLPQSRDPSGRVTSHLRRAEVDLPDGLSLNPPLADGLQVCDDSALRLGSRDPAGCPAGSRVGSTRIDVPILGGSLQGGLYARPQTADETYRVAVVASGFGVNVKLPGVVRPDPITGRVKAIFDETPQVPFSNITIALDGGPRAAVATGLTCNSQAAVGAFTPWSGTATVSAPSRPLAVSWDGAGSACPALPFAPVLSGGSRSSASGTTSPFNLRLQREDRNQEVRSLQVATPLGLTAIVRGVPLCGLAQAAAGTCSQESRVGSLVVGAGAGTNPFYVRGSAYLTRGYKGAPYGLSFVVPVVAGPFNLGTVVVQAKIEVDPVSAQLRVSSDAFPRIVRGVPLRVRDLRVDIDRPRFTLNPTNCKVQSTVARVGAFQGALTDAKTPFQASGCARQRYKPSVGLALRGKRATTDGKHPALAAVVKQSKGSANISKVVAKLPSSLALDPDNAQALCEFEAGQRVQCPKSSIVGRAKITTPLLNKPLRGPVYFVKNVRRNKAGRLIRTLPTLLVTLRGEVALNLRAKTSVAGGKNLVTTFSGLPDQPFSRFDLFLNGGGGGILVANTNLCKGSLTAELETNGQNGKRSDPSVKMTRPCG